MYLRMYRKFEEIYRIVHRKRLEIHSMKVYNMLRAVNHTAHDS